MGCALNVPHIKFKDGSICLVHIILGMFGEKLNKTRQFYVLSGMFISLFWFSSSILAQRNNLYNTCLASKDKQSSKELTAAKDTNIFWWTSKQG